MGLCGKIPIDETARTATLQGFFISPVVAQPNTFGVKAPVFTLAQRGNPACCSSVSSTKSSVEAGVFVFLGYQGKGYFTVSEEWKDKVYHPQLEERNWDATDWRKIRKNVLKQDNYTCQRCGYLDNLTVHHIKPRAEGGGDNLENLITLCTGCHDEVEILGYKSKWQIMNQFEEDYPIDDIRYTTDDWHGWVYGAGRRPRKKK